jgi:hypothetical protein
MNFQLTDLARMFLGLLAGSALGYLFGMVQRAALRRHEKLLGRGEFGSGWTVVPGSFRRVGFLLIALVLVQIVCPILFVGGTEWLVSAGVILGYGAVLYQQWRSRKDSPAAPNRPPSDNSRSHYLV